MFFRSVASEKMSNRTRNGAEFEPETKINDTFSPPRYKLVSGHVSHISMLVRASGDGVTKSGIFFIGAGGFGKVALESSIARNSIGNRFPVQKYVGAMVR